MSKNVLLDNEFLVELDNYQRRELYVKIISLTLEEDPLDEIEGRITGGSISIDGDSKLRRSCSLNLISTRLNINDYLWCLNTKIKVFIGMKNFIQENPLDGYGDIIWFPQGTFVLNSFSLSVNNNSSSISLQGKDKMCLLNGDVGGNLTALSYAFDVVEEENGYNSYYKRKIPLYYIIREAVHTFANEPYHNIIINDLDDWGLELMKYRGEEPLYFVYDLNTEDITNMTVNASQSYYILQEGEYKEKTIADLEANGFCFKVLNNFITQEDGSDSVYIDYEGEKKEYKLIKIETGMTCGYRLTDLVYASDLTLNVGEGLTSMLDKIVSMLGNFEYFYNLEGQFIFQKKRTYITTSWNNLVNNNEEQWADNSAYTSSSVYSLQNSKLVSQFQNSPALNNVKNDFSIWGTKKGTTGIELPIHMRYAIDQKPTYYTTVDGSVTYTTKNEEQVIADKASGLLSVIGKGYEKEPSRFGLSEEWWEVRDWANAWKYSGLDIPKGRLGEYCPIRVGLYCEGYRERLPATWSRQYELYEIPASIWRSWGLDPAKYIASDDLIFTGDGKYKASHGSCAHSYDQYWLKAFDEGGQYAGGYAYFYKPQIPADVIAEHGGQGLILGNNIVYNADWRELIYQMALDHNKYGNVDNKNLDVQLVKTRKVGDSEDSIMTKSEYNELRAESRVTDYCTDISLNTAIRERNPLIFPSGYTGCEQYYIDILGFWRQLYDPSYENSYSVEPLTKAEYDAVWEENTLFYDKPIYAPCTNLMVFYDNIDYYTRDNDTEEYSLATMLTESDFNRNKSRYYYIKDVEIAPVPIKKNDIITNQNYYKIGNYDTVVSDDVAKNNPQDYCIRTEHVTESDIWTLEPFNAAYLYSYRKNGTYYPATQEVQIGDKIEIRGITKSDYESRPWYYYRVKDGKQVCCTHINAPLPRNRSERVKFKFRNQYGGWTTAENGTTHTLSDGKRITFSPIISNEDLEAYCLDIAYQSWDLYNLDSTPMATLLVIEDSYYTYEPLIHPGIDFDPSGTYYVKNDIIEFNKYLVKAPEPENCILAVPELAPYWKTDLLTNPESLIFWFDFLDTDGDVGNYSVKRIGDRPKAVNDKDVKAIYFRETPDVLFVSPEMWEEYQTTWDKPTGYVYVQVPKYLSHLFSISGQGKSAKDVLDEYLYKYSYCTETVTVTSLPIYHLEPNTRILIRDDNSHINGEYIVNKLTIPLDPKGTMTINAVKAIDRLY